MGEQPFDSKRLLVLRKLTRAVAEPLRERARQYVNTLAPLLRPRVALGDVADGGTRDPFQAADKTFKELQALYEPVASAEPFNLHKDLKPPLELAAGSLELSPLEYTYRVKADGGEKSIRVTSPLKWVLSYAGVTPTRLTPTSFGPRRLKELLTGSGRPVDELRQFLVHYLALHLAVSRQSGLGRLLEALHFQLSSEKLREFGQLPVPCLSYAVKTVRPPDDVLLEHTEIAGTDAFEEVVDVSTIDALRDGDLDRLTELVRQHGLSQHKT